MTASPRHRRHFLGQRPVRNALLGVGVLLVGAGLLLPLGDATSTLPAADTQQITLRLSDPAAAATARPSQPAPAPASANPVNTAESQAPTIDWQRLRVRSGDNLAAVFKRAGLTARDVHEVVNASDEATRLTRLYPGDEILLHITADSGLQRLRYEIDDTRTLVVEPTPAGGTYTTRIETRELERRVAVAEGRINTSLYHAGAEAGLDDRLIMELAGIFGWDIDFALDIRRNDRFTVIYETLFRDGEKVRNGRILAAEFVNRGDRFRALRFEDADGRSDYYTPEGRSMRKAFLRTPTDFTRVSSEFNPNRVHPIYGTERPHVGTDYAAPPGTPIVAAGDGKIIHRGRKGGYGNTVILQHGTRYTTLYAHMRRFASGQSTGDRVQQGEVIGYVGSTGLSTGPHLHYEFRVDGVHRNPRTVELPTAEPLDRRYQADFRASTDAWIARLDRMSQTRIAQASD